jgi:(p)ppGpp synthase/HD superfamily hydrolase
MTPTTMLTDRFDRALLLASQAHRHQRRKGSTVPYIAHLLAVCALVLEHGGDEDQGVAALLHDAPEDQGGAAMLARIAEQFGARVGELVAACGEPVALKGAAWQQRKEAFLQSLAVAPPEALLIIAADKVHNLATLLDERRRCGEAVFERFGGKKEGTLWYYARLSEALPGRVPTLLGRRLAALAGALEAPTGVC